MVVHIECFPFFSVFTVCNEKPLRLGATVVIGKYEYQYKNATTQYPRRGTRWQDDIPACPAMEPWQW